MRSALLVMRDGGVVVVRQESCGGCELPVSDLPDDVNRVRVHGANRESVGDGLQRRQKKNRFPNKVNEVWKHV
jgi:Na+-translocating ferredoxin:NAD+ oxidoreductase RNF subunit RnfB